MTGVLLTIDTELTWRAHMAGAGWEENIARSFEAAGVGIPYQLERLRRHGLKACFFVDPMPALLFGIEPVRRLIAPIVAAGQSVQLHLHPMWRDADRRGSGEGRLFELAGLPFEDQRALIEQARELLAAAGGGTPIAFRAGSFAADEATLRAVAVAGLRYDSSHDGGQMPWPCQTGLPPHATAPFRVHGVIELPVGVLDDGGGRLRHLQIGAVSFAEVRGALLHAEAVGNPLLTIVGHSFELATRDGARVNRLVRARFNRLCAWLAAHRDRFPTRSVEELDGLPLGIDAGPAPARSLVRIGRVAAQGVSNLFYEGRL